MVTHQVTRTLTSFVMAVPAASEVAPPSVSSLRRRSSCRLMFCRMLSSREASATCRSVGLTNCCDSHCSSDSGAAAAASPPAVSWLP